MYIVNLSIELVFSIQYNRITMNRVGQEIRMQALLTKAAFCNWPRNILSMSVVSSIGYCLPCSLGKRTPWTTHENKQMKYLFNLFIFGQHLLLGYFYPESGMVLLSRGTNLMSKCLCKTLEALIRSFQLACHICLHSCSRLYCELLLAEELVRSIPLVKVVNSDINIGYVFLCFKPTLIFLLPSTCVTLTIFKNKDSELKIIDFPEFTKTHIALPMFS